MRTVLKWQLGGAIPSLANDTLLVIHLRESQSRTAEWETELLHEIELDPHEVGVSSANWTAALLAVRLGEKTGITVTQETVWSYLHAHGYICKSPTWTLQRKAEEKAD